MKDRGWHFLIFAIALPVATVALIKSLAVAVMLFSLEVNRSLVPAVKRQKPVLGVLAWLGCVILLAGLYYVADLLLFPHSSRVIFRARDSITGSIIGMVYGFIAQYWLAKREEKLAVKQG